MERLSLVPGLYVAPGDFDTLERAKLALRQLRSGNFADLSNALLKSAFIRPGRCRKIQQRLPVDDDGALFTIAFQHYDTAIA
ncbi:hypothetical protein ATY79_11840 [Rhizobium sp. R693]|nr:hypothetical protein ATY79_11840 [Rhizobium sp. R693]